MTRLPGFSYFDPGIYSLTVPYHDVNDFFYSGHVGTCLLIVLEYRAAKYYKMSYFTLFILLNQWTMLFLVRTHYIIDLITGVIMAHYMFIQAERLSFISDVLVLGISGGKNRFRFSWRPCKVCGWAHQHAADFMMHEEKKILKQMHQDQRVLFKLKGSPISKGGADLESIKLGTLEKLSKNLGDEKVKYEKHYDEQV